MLNEFLGGWQDQHLAESMTQLRRMYERAVITAAQGRNELGHYDLSPWYSIFPIRWDIMCILYPGKW